LLFDTVEARFEAIEAFLNTIKAFDHGGQRVVQVFFG
jgi:hypothetical protein